MCALSSKKDKPDHRAKAQQVTKDFLDHLENQFRSEQLEKVYELHSKIADVVKPYRLETVITALEIIEQQVIASELAKPEKGKSENAGPGIS